MRVRVVHRAAALAVALTIAGAGAAFADLVSVDGDEVASIQTLVDLGTVAPNSTHKVDVTLVLECRGILHLDHGSIVTATPVNPGIPPTAGGSISGTPAAIGPVPDTWPLDSSGCGIDPPVLAGSVSQVTVVAPPTAGTGYTYRLDYQRSSTDGIPASSMTFINIRLSVGGNTPPSVDVPGDMEREADTTGGWTGVWTATATDAEDETDPTPNCSPAAGSVLLVGVTTVTCTATDTAGASASADFRVTVVDTTPPTLGGVPTGLTLATADPAGAVLDYELPTASDIADDSPTVTCAPAPGERAPVGPSTVTCTATDDSGNTTAASFPVTVAMWSAAWLEPVTGSVPGLTVQGGRSIPLKVALLRGGVPVSTGSPSVAVAPCAGGAAVATTGLAWSDGPARWVGKLDTTGLAFGCYRVRVLVDGVGVGWFELTVAGGEPMATHKRR